MGPSDPRKQPWSYITDGKRLYEVLKVTERRELVLEDCSSFVSRRVEAWRVTAWPWRLVRAAPTTLSEEEA